MEWYKSNGYGETVIEVEKTPTCLFVRKNIERVEEIDEMTGAVSVHWRYDEAKTTPEEYELYLNAVEAAKDVSQDSDTSKILAALLGG